MKKIIINLLFATGFIAHADKTFEPSMPKKERQSFAHYLNNLLYEQLNATSLSEDVRHVLINDYADVIQKCLERHLEKYEIEQLNTFVNNNGIERITQSLADAIHSIGNDLKGTLIKQNMIQENESLTVKLTCGIETK